jgi:hypothetical protein
MKILLLAAAMLLICGLANAATNDYFVRGIVRDATTNEPIAYAAVSITGQTVGTVSDNKGIFDMTVPNNTRSLTIWRQGYAKKVIEIKKSHVNLYEVLLTPEAETLGEVVIKKRKYSKKNNPAVDLMQRIRQTAEANDPCRNPYYNYEKYERITLGLNDFNEKKQNNFLFKNLPFLWEHVDTSEISGKPVLNLSVKETSSDVHYRRDPKTTREVINGVQSSGIDDIADQANTRTFLEDVMREIDLYDKDINLMQNRFVSPLSPLAADFYKFYITDSLEIDGDKCIALSFYPHNKAAFGFVGQMYVVPGDTTMFIKRVTMRVPAEINLNFIQNMYVNQEFKRAADGSRLKVKDDLVLEMKVLPAVPGLYVRRNVAYGEHNFDRPSEEEEVFGVMAPVVIEKGAESRNEEFWSEARMIPMQESEQKTGQLMTRLRARKGFYWGEKVLRCISYGYVGTKPTGSKFDIGPLNTFISQNKLQGTRIKFGGMSTASLSKHWFTRLTGAYGTRDHRWKYNVEFEYSFNEKKLHSREFPVHSIRLNSSYDVDQLGQHYLYTSYDNFFLSLKRMSGSNRSSYRLLNSLTYTLELENNFSFTAIVNSERHYGSKFMQLHLSDADATPIKHFDETWLDVEFRYAPGEKFYQTRAHRFPVNQDAPTVTLRHRFATTGLPGTRWGVNRTELGIEKRIWFSAWGYADVTVQGGHVWSKETPYTQIFIPNANLTYTIRDGSYSLMNPMEFVTDTYAAADVTYWANGAILNYIPLIKKLKMREVFSYHMYWGKLSPKNDPRYHDNMLAMPDETIGTVDISRTPYMEAGVGLDNILKCLRIDYVWRLTHRNPGYKIDRSGVRIAFHLTF